MHLDDSLPPATAATVPPPHAPDPMATARAVRRRSFATLATVSRAGRPHVAGVLYEQVGGHLYVSTLRSSRKARNIAANPYVAVCIPIRRVPVGPPSSVHFQGSAELLRCDDATIRRLVGAGELTSITSHGELDLADGCVVRIAVPRRVNTYGLGMSLVELARHPLAGAGVTTLPE